MRRLLLFALLLAAVNAVGQTTNPSCVGSPLSTTQTCTIGNTNGAYGMLVDVVPSGSPSGLTVTVQGCAPNGTCDTAANTCASASVSSCTDSSTSEALLKLTLSAPYAYLKVTATLSGGTSPTVAINPTLSTANAHTGGSSSSGTVTSVSVTTANGVSGTVATATTTPAITLVLGAVTPTSVAPTGFSAASATTGVISVGTLGFSDTGLIFNGQASTNGYLQMVLQNTSNGASASTDYIVANDQGTATTHYGDFGINSSGFTSTGNLTGLAGETYLYATSGDLGLGTFTANAIHLVANNATIDALTISSANLVSLPTGGALTLGTSGSTAPSIVFNNASTGTITLAPVTGALGSAAINLPAASGTLILSSSALTSGALVLGGGGQAATVSTNFTTSGSTLTLGTTGATGILCIAGTTAGVCANLTTTAAGLTLVFPNGSVTNPGLQFADMTSNTGLYSSGAALLGWVEAGNVIAQLNANGLEVGSGGILSFSSSAGAGGAIDTTLCRSAAGVAEINSGTGCGLTGSLKLASLTGTGIVRSTNNDVILVADTTTITATTAGTATTVFTFPALTVSTNYSIHCSGTTTQATAGGGIGMAVTFATTAPTQAELHALVSTSLTALNAGATQLSTGNISTTTATAIYSSTSGTVTTQLPWSIDGSIEVGATAPSSIVIGFFSASASDAVVVKRDSFCHLFV